MSWHSARTAGSGHDRHLALLRELCELASRLALFRYWRSLIPVSAIPVINYHFQGRSEMNPSALQCWKTDQGWSQLHDHPALFSFLSILHFLLLVELASGG